MIVINVPLTGWLAGVALCITYSLPPVLLPLQPPPFSSALLLHSSPVCADCNAMTEMSPLFGYLSDAGMWHRCAS